MQVRARSRTGKVELPPPPEPPLNVGSQPGLKHSRHRFSLFDERVYLAAIEDTGHLIAMLAKLPVGTMSIMARHLRMETRVWLFYAVSSGRYKYNRFFSAPLIDALSLKRMREDNHHCALPTLVLDCILEGKTDREAFNELDQWTTDAWRLAAKRLWSE